MQYAVSDGLSIAYTRFGHGDEVAVYLPAWVSNVELIWDLAEFSRAYERAGNHHQVITIDKRGVGLSDRTNEPPTLEDRVADALAVLDAEGVEDVGIVDCCGIASVNRTPRPASASDSADAVAASFCAFVVDGEFASVLASQHETLPIFT